MEQYRPRVVVLDMSRVPDLEYSALQMLVEGEKRTTERGTTLWLAALNPSVLKVVRQSGLAESLGRERLLLNARAAIERFQRLQGVAEGDTRSGRSSSSLRNTDWF